jgi:hypothetical protein
MRILSILVFISILFSYAAIASLPPTSTQGSGGGGYKTTFRFNFPNQAITYSGTTATLGALGVAGGGTGLATLTTNSVILGNGTSSPIFVAPGPSGNILTSNGTTWQSVAAASGGLNQLTGDVTAGPGSGSQVATIAPLAVTNAKIANSTIDLATKVTGALPILNGGSGQTTANAALNAFLPSQTGNAGRILGTNATNSSWVGLGGVSYTPTTPANWLSVPTQGQQALDNLAAQRPVINVGGEFVGSVKIASCASNFSVNSGSWSDLNTQSGCSYTTRGDITAPTGSNTAAFIISSGQAGHYEISYAGYIGNNSGSGAQCDFRLNDGTVSSNEEITPNYNPGAYGLSGFATWSFDFGSSFTNKQIKVQAIRDASADCSLSGTSGNPGVFTIKYYPPENSTTVDIFEAGDFGWTQFTPSFTNNATINSSNFFYRRVGDSMDIMGYVSFGSGGAASDLQLALPASKVIDSTKVPARRTFGDINFDFSNASEYKITGVGGNAFLNVTAQAQPGGVATNITGAGISSANLFIQANGIPIDGWSTFPLGIATGDGVKRYAARIANNGTASITSQKPSFLSSVSNGGTGVISVSYTGSTFTNTPACTCGGEGPVYCYVQSVSNTGITIRTLADNNTNQNVDVALSCTSMD